MDLSFPSPSIIQPGEVSQHTFISLLSHAFLLEETKVKGRYQLVVLTSPIGVQVFISISFHMNVTQLKSILTHPLHHKCLTKDNFITTDKINIILQPEQVWTACLKLTTITFHRSKQFTLTKLALS